MLEGANFAYNLTSIDMKSVNQLVYRLNNSILRGASFIVISKWNKTWLLILKKFYKEGFLQTLFVNNGNLFIFFRYYQGVSCIQKLTLWSKCSQEITLTRKELLRVKNSAMLLLLSTPFGVLTAEECLKRGIGGIALVSVY